MIIKEPKRFVATLFLIYIIFFSLFLVNEFSKKHDLNSFTGFGTKGVFSIKIIKSGNATCNVGLKQNYNFVSFCANMTNSSISAVLNPIDGQYDFILRWNRTSQDFDVYSPEAASNSFSKFEINQSYVIFMKQDSSLSMSGPEVKNLNITLTNQFNAPSYPYFVTTNVTKYINPIKENVSFVLKFNTSSQDFIVYSPEAASNQFTTISTGEGQFIYITSPDTVLRYNKTLLGT